MKISNNTIKNYRRWIIAITKEPARPQLIAKLFPLLEWMDIVEFEEALNDSCFVDALDDCCVVIVVSLPLIVVSIELTMVLSALVEVDPEFDAVSCEVTEDDGNHQTGLVVVLPISSVVTIVVSGSSA